MMNDNYDASALPNVMPDGLEQEEIVRICNQFKQSVQCHSSAKKDRLRTCYAYTKNRFVGNDLLPIPSTEGNDRDLNQSRPQVFIPLTRQQLKSIYAQLKLTIFPNDQDFFRIRAKKESGVANEDILTEGVKYIFKDAMITEKIGTALYNLIWSGYFAVFPSLKEDFNVEWCFEKANSDNLSTSSKASTDRYVAKPMLNALLPDLENFNPIDFYIDPNTQDSDRAKWVYVTRKRLYEIVDSPLYFNKNFLENLQTRITLGSNRLGSVVELDSFNDLSGHFEDVENHLDYDLYYFPYLKTEKQEYRNMLVGVAGGKILIRFHPNTFPRGMNPVVFCSWMSESGNPYGMGPVEDLIDLQKMINMLWNYKLEVMARSGNRFAIRPNVDLSNFFGVAGGVMVTEDPRGDIINLSGDYAEIAHIDNTIGILKSEAQITSGAQNPFQGSASVDYKKTATELQILQESSISVIREVVEHISVTGVRRILERLLYLIASIYTEPVEIAFDHPMLGRQYRMVDFSLLASGDYSIELVSINPSQSKGAQVNGLMQLLQLISEKPEMLRVAEPLIEKIGELYGIKNIKDLISQLKERMRP